MNRSKRGFTLAELLIVVAIIAVLVGVAIPVFNSQLEKSRESTDIANLRNAMSIASVMLNSGDVADDTVLYYNPKTSSLEDGRNITISYGKGTSATTKESGTVLYKAGTAEYTTDTVAVDGVIKCTFSAGEVSAEFVQLSSIDKSAALNGSYVIMSGSELIDAVTTDGTSSALQDATSIVFPNVTAIASNAARDLKNLKEITIPGSVISIGDFAFCQDYKLSTVNLNEGLETLGMSVFHNCTSIKTIDLPDSLKTIGRFAFYCCTQLTEITVPPNVTSIGDYAFKAGSGKLKVTIPKTVTGIDPGAFNGLNGGTVYYQGTEEEWAVSCPGGLSNSKITVLFNQ